MGPMLQLLRWWSSPYVGGYTMSDQENESCIAATDGSPRREPWVCLPSPGRGDRAFVRECQCQLCRPIRGLRLKPPLIPRLTPWATLCRLSEAWMGNTLVAGGHGAVWDNNCTSHVTACQALVGCGGSGPGPALADSLQPRLSHVGLSARNRCQPVTGFAMP